MKKIKFIWLRSLFPAIVFTLLIHCATFADGQTCLTADDMDQPTRTALENTAKRYFDMAMRGDAASLKQNAIPSLANSFSGVEDALKENQPDLLGAQPSVRPPFLLKVEGQGPLAKGEFLCGVFGANGQTANSAEFVIPNLMPGNYGITVVDSNGGKAARTLTLVLQQEGNSWKLGGFYIRDPQIAEHDSKWFLDKARAFKAKGQTRNAWYYYLAGRDLLTPVNFMYTQTTDKLYDEMQAVKPSDLPTDGPVDLTSAGKSYKLAAVFPAPQGKDFYLVVKYDWPDVSNSSKTFEENMAVMKALLVKFPEFRDGFDGIVARAVDPSGHDYGTMMAMKDIK
jgi:hypothetical protein